MRLRESDGRGRPQWRLTPTLEAKTSRTAVDHLVLSLPPNYEYDRQVGPVPADVVEMVTPDSQNQVLQIKLAQKQLRPFSFKLAGSYAVPRDSQEASLELPRPLKWSVERGAANDRPITTVVAGSEALDRGGHGSGTLPGGLGLGVPQGGTGVRAKGA